MLPTARPSTPLARPPLCGGRRAGARPDGSAFRRRSSNTCSKSVRVGIAPVGTRAVDIALMFDSNALFDRLPGARRPSWRRCWGGGHGARGRAPVGSRSGESGPGRRGWHGPPGRRSVRPAAERAVPGAAPAGRAADRRAAARAAGRGAPGGAPRAPGGRGPASRWASGRSGASRCGDAVRGVPGAAAADPARLGRAVGPARSRWRRWPCWRCPRSWPAARSSPSPGRAASSCSRATPCGRSRRRWPGRGGRAGGRRRDRAAQRPRRCRGGPGPGADGPVTGPAGARCGPQSCRRSSSTLGAASLPGPAGEPTYVLRRVH